MMKITKKFLDEDQPIYEEDLLEMKKKLINIFYNHLLMMITFLILDLKMILKVKNIKILNL